MNFPEERASNLEQVHVVLTGRVQGVGFRAYIQQVAISLGLTGWVRNVGWNQVEIVAEGKRSALERLIEAAQRGPVGSRVDDFQVEWQPYSGEFSRFEIRLSR